MSRGQLGGIAVNGFLVNRGISQTLSRPRQIRTYQQSLAQGRGISKHSFRCEMPTAHSHLFLTPPENRRNLNHGCLQCLTNFSFPAKAKPDSYTKIIPGISNPLCTMNLFHRTRAPLPQFCLIKGEERAGLAESASLPQEMAPYHPQGESPAVTGVRSVCVLRLLRSAIAVKVELEETLFVRVYPETIHCAEIANFYEICS